MGILHKEMSQRMQLIPNLTLEMMVHEVQQKVVVKS